MENYKRFKVTECPFHANKEYILKRINELMSFKRAFSMKSEAYDGLSSCSNVHERSTDTELAANKPVLLI